MCATAPLRKDGEEEEASGLSDLGRREIVVRSTACAPVYFKKSGPECTYLFGCAGATEKNDLTLWSWSHIETLDLQNIFLSVNLHFSGKSFVIEPALEPLGLTPAAGPL